MTTDLEPLLRAASAGDDGALTALGLCLQATRPAARAAAEQTATALQLEVRALAPGERARVLTVLHDALAAEAHVVRALWALRQDGGDDALAPVDAVLDDALASAPDGVVAEQALGALLTGSPARARAAATRAAQRGTGDVAATAARWLSLHGP